MENLQKQKAKCNSINKWWELGKIYFKILAINYSKQHNLELKKRQQKLIKQILEEKTENPTNLNNINIWQEQLLELQNYEAQGTVIRSREETIINEEKPSKFFYHQEKQKQNKTKKNSKKEIK